MSLQPSSHPEARSLIAVFSLSIVILLGSLLAHFTDLQVKVRDLPLCVRVVDEVAVQDQAQVGLASLMKCKITITSNLKLINSKLDFLRRML